MRFSFSTRTERACRFFKHLLPALTLLCTWGNALAQVNVTASQTANALAQNLVGAGVTVSNPILNCPSNANGIFTVVTSNLGLDSGIVLTSGQAATVGATIGVNGPNTNAGPSQDNNAPGDPDLNTVLNGLLSADRCVLEFDFVPAGDTVKFDYVFASTEYQAFSCSNFNDVFGFFISGPGYAVPTNIALIPGTNIPICVNSTTGVTTGALCTGMGPGSPFSQYYVNNMGGTTITYGGFTTIFTAIAGVSPCNTYHLKLAIADGSSGGTDRILDSGVFLKAGSLTSNAVFASPIGGGGLNLPVPYCVRGCLPGRIVFSRPVASANPLTIKYLIQGDAINGVDYSLIADSVVIAPGQLTDTLIINPLPAVGGGGGEDTVRLLVLSPYTCGNGSLQILDTAELVIRDSFYVKILSNDTAVCKFESVNIIAEGDSLLSYFWTPALWLNNPNVMNPVATPLQTVTYTINATLPGSGCAPATDKITITIKEEPQVNAGPDRIICSGTSVPFNVTVTPVGQPYNITWSPGTYLTNTNTFNPVSTPATDITYYIVVDPGAVGCNGYDTVSIRVLPDDIFLANKDSSVCKGVPIQINAIGDPAFSYNWTPTMYVSDPVRINPIITPDTSITYTLTATFPGCPPIVKTIKFDVQPVPTVNIGPDRELCQFDTIHLSGVVGPTWYQNYSYLWTPASGLSNPTERETVLTGNTNIAGLTLTVKTPAGCMGSDDMNITVFPGNFGTLTPSTATICPRDTVNLEAGGGTSYSWTPAYYLSDPTSPNPQAYPTNTGAYSVVIRDDNGCTDTLTSFITVFPDATLDAGQDVTIFPGESTQLNAAGNGLYFQWFPTVGLSSTNVSNPIASPESNTKYYVQITTENGCIATDSVSVFVSDETVLNMPNAFAPGGQANNQYKVPIRGIASLKSFRIFNRWGTKVFETTDINEGWDGRHNGELQPMGVYIYTIEAVTNTGRSFTKQGNITLIR